MYTEIFFAAEVDEDAYDLFAKVKETGEFPEGQTHPFFATPRASQIFHCGSFYFPGAGHFEVEFDDIGPTRSVSFRGNLKNYDGEIEAFFDWVAPHCKWGSGNRGFIGYSIYEDSDNAPTLYFSKGN